MNIHHAFRDQKPTKTPKPVQNAATPEHPTVSVITPAKSNPSEKEEEEDDGDIDPGVVVVRTSNPNLTKKAVRDAVSNIFQRFV